MQTDRYLKTLHGMLQPHVILPVQHFPCPKKLKPEHRLMMGVLDDAVECVRKYRGLGDPTSRRLFSEASQWLLAVEPHWPYSFERICAALDLDAGAVRRCLRVTPR